VQASVFAFGQGVDGHFGVGVEPEGAVLLSLELHVLLKLLGVVLLAGPVVEVCD